MASNCYKVNKRTWTRWSKGRQAVFNRVFGELKSGAHMFDHPEAADIPQKHWRTIAWNAAWIASDHAEQVGEESVSWTEQSTI